MNLNEIQIPPDADEATDWAVRREFGLRWDAYHGGLVREVGLAEMRALCPACGGVGYHPDMGHCEECGGKRVFACPDPEASWIADMQYSIHWERCVP